MKFLKSVVLLVILPFILNGQSGANLSLKGNVIDQISNEPIIGVSVGILNLKTSTLSKLDGSFRFDKLKPGTYNLHFTSVGFQAKDTIVVLEKSSEITVTLQENNVQLNEVVVMAAENKETEISAKKIEQFASNQLNVISAKAIQLSADITIANVLQRVSGISVERSGSGDARYAIIRGMDKRYNYTLINGIKIPSPDNKNRYVPMDIFPSDLVERVEVNKTLTPDMEGDAIGGSVNLVMKNAPENLYINGSVSSGYSQNLFEKPFMAFPVQAIQLQSPYEKNGPLYMAQPADFTRDNLNYTPTKFTPNAIANLSIGNRFFDNKLGIMFGGSYQNTYRAYQSIFSPGVYYDETNKPGSLQIKHANLRDYSNQLTRTGLNVKLDYRLNQKHRLNFYSFYAILDDAQNRMTNDTLQPPPRVGYGTGQVWYFGRSKFQTQRIYNATLEGVHQLIPHLNFKWIGAYSFASSNIPDLAEYEYDTGFFQDGTNPKPYQHPNKVVNYHRIWENNQDKDLSGYGQLAYSNTLNQTIPFTFTLGGMYRNKTRTNLYQDYELRTIPNPDGSFQLWKDIYQFNWSVFNTTGSPANPNTYRATENIGAAFGMLKLTFKRLEGLAGVRMETTEQSFETDVPKTIAGKTGNISYADYLPSLHLKYVLNKKSNLRFSYFNSINRPSYFEIVPTLRTGDEYDELGNPKLLHAKADNIDFRYEFFPRPNEQLLIGAFYKKITNPIEYGFSGDKVQYYQPQNFGNAVNYGLEIVFEKYVKDFGIRLNYTYTHSSITTTKLKTFNNQLVSPAPEQTRPLQGQSPHIANASLLYKNLKRGIDLQLAWQFTGERISLVSPYYEFDQWQNSLSLFDFSAEKKMGKHLGLFAKIQNLLNTPDLFYINQKLSNSYPVSYQTPGDSKTLSSKNMYGQNYQLGLRYIL